MNRRQTTGKAEIVQRQEVSGPATRWLPGDNIQFPIERLAGGDVGQVGGGALVTVDPALYAVGGSEEYATPVSRAKGQVIRLLPFTAVWLILAGGIVWLLGMTWPWLLVMFAGLTAFTYLKMNRDEFDHSRNGLERHRVDTAADLREKELDQTHELKKMALTTYLQIARAQYLGVSDDKPTE
ncbi:MAG: hypothetical protein HY328_15590 [Chloroflexi bacterium]|nr:hypothetical protein [Chloroflexota bacterium]